MSSAPTHRDTPGILIEVPTRFATTERWVNFLRQMMDHPRAERNLLEVQEAIAEARDVLRERCKLPPELDGQG